MKKKLRVALLFGGKSAEHEISLISARNIFEAMDKKKYDVVAIGIDKQGRWLVDEKARCFCSGVTPAAVDLHRCRISPLLSFPETRAPPWCSHRRAPRSAKSMWSFPVLHGPFGEDGTVQGLLKLANIPFVGAGVLGSAVGMDKDVMKRLLRDASIPIANFAAFQRADRKAIRFAAVKKQLGLPLFVKPANLGSSVGISKVSKKNQFEPAVEERPFATIIRSSSKKFIRRPRDRMLGSRQRTAHRVAPGRDRRATGLLFL